MTENNLATLSIADLQDGYSRHAFSPVEVVESLLTRIAALDPQVHAFITLAAEQALAEARACEAELSGGRQRGLLHGIPFAAKDLYDSAGLRTTYGAALFAEHMPHADAMAIKRLKAAGAILVGKTATHEFGWGITTISTHFGATHNPWHLDRVAGGSSGGSAVALATGMVPAALGSDTGGSIRIPANFCGVVGLKPTYQRISAAGVIPLAPSLDHPGPMARTVRDVAALLNVLAGYKAGDPSTAQVAVPDYTAGLDRGISALRVGICPDLHLLPLDAAVQRVFDQSVDLLARLGARIVEVALPTAPLIEEAFRGIQWSEAYHVHHAQRRLFPAEAASYGKDVAARLELASNTSLREYLDALQAQRRVKADFARLFAQEIEILVTPIAAGGPALIGNEDVVHAGQTIPFRSLVMPYTVPQDLCGLPTCAVRAGFDDEGIPVGIQFTGPSWGEGIVLRSSNAFFVATEALQQRRPPIAAESPHPGVVQAGNEAHSQR